ncbi:hypothetical protein A0H81_01732 [Grifola frondosa]|uniref:Uncharacterized protein n=1 Tax=Grifola frondosa TaxID=5627 RepID=A0A1C7MML0_GRIFR|nr:hypothetical protein A0H81_01732 [Grifola frondosa]
MGNGVKFPYHTDSAVERKITLWRIPTGATCVVGAFSQDAQAKMPYHPSSHPLSNVHRGLLRNMYLPSLDDKKPCMAPSSPYLPREATFLLPHR